jgi:hypothetical protein
MVAGLSKTTSDISFPWSSNFHVLSTKKRLRNGVPLLVAQTGPEPGQALQSLRPFMTVLLLKMLLMVAVVAEFTWNGIEQDEWCWLPNKAPVMGRKQNRIKRVSEAFGGAKASEVLRIIHSPSSTHPRPCLISFCSQAQDQCM